MAFREADTEQARHVLERGLLIAQDSGNRAYESHLAVTTARLEAEYGHPLAALDYARQAIRIYHDSGNTTLMLTPLAVLAALLHRLRRHVPAATIAGFALNPFTEAVLPEFNSAINQPTRNPWRRDLRIACPQG